MRRSPRAARHRSSDAADTAERLTAGAGIDAVLAAELAEIIAVPRAGTRLSAGAQIVALSHDLRLYDQTRLNAEISHHLNVEKAATAKQQHQRGNPRTHVLPPSPTPEEGCHTAMIFTLTPVFEF